jgi:hypothetical protein
VFCCATGRSSREAKYGSITAIITTAGKIALLLLDATAGHKISINFTRQTITEFTPKLPSGGRKTLKAPENSFRPYSEASPPATY